ncbi:polysaccharide deacetylase [Roseibacterium elongatum DSM 19469]|uniref:Chitooligosaccharide deacetylase n=1 Tax=Roseicyclus elongatus DSM 19469 TaxID=1294273 RepID=W8RUS9_9RHOB|nr:polysaccharide deacetylase family protein [Roseibacterium elongatum]AHM04944.1 polysaccharide deacetylase [Roseibacterium elongatum DSM 19469]
MSQPSRPRFDRRKALIAIGAALASPALTGRAGAHAIPASFGGDGPVTRGADVTVQRVNTRQPLVALTFDDGPHPRLTPQLLDILSAANVRATFYMIGRSVARHPQLAARVAAEGHEIGNHTWSHPNLTGRSDAGVLDQIDRTSIAIQEAVGRPPVTMRPPYGNFHDRQRLMLFRERNLPTVLWSVDPQDWQRPGATVVTQRIVRSAHPGAVVLAHDIHGPTIRAMPSTISDLAARGFRFVTVSELIGWPRWDQRRIRLAARSPRD